jgi:hypothetical protein
MLDVGLVHPFEPDRLHQLLDALEIRAHVDWQSIELSLNLGVEKNKRPCHRTIYLFCNNYSSGATPAPYLLSLSVVYVCSVTAEGYFGRVSKGLIHDAVREGIGSGAAPKLANLKKTPWQNALGALGRKRLASRDPALGLLAQVTGLSLASG